MTSYLKGLGYKLTTKDTLNNKEFRLVEESVEVNEELTTFSNTVTSSIQVYELFLATRRYTLAKVEGIVQGANDNGDIVTGSSSTEIQERGYLITLTFIKEG